MTKKTEATKELEPVKAKLQETIKKKKALIHNYDFDDGEQEKERQKTTRQKLVKAFGNPSAEPNKRSNLPVQLNSYERAVLDILYYQSGELGSRSTILRDMLRKAVDTIDPDELDKHIKQVQSYRAKLEADGRRLIHDPEYKRGRGRKVKAAQKKA